ncbi:hypothetical protein [Chloroflexus sp.]|nr:hypothetical protein [Chloroflexus sp.]MDW8403841.1 hypothetical protein [Chloroflexus sp.]
MKRNNVSLPAKQALAGLAEIAVGGLGNAHGQTHSRHKAARQA